MHAEHQINYVSSPFVGSFFMPGGQMTTAEIALSGVLTILGGALFGSLALIGVIVVALATAKVRATTPAGSLEIDGDDD